MMTPDAIATAPEVGALVEVALREDRAWEDVTTALLVPPDVRASGVILAKGAGVLAGLPVAAFAFHRVDPAVELEALVPEGARVTPGTAVARVSGRAASLLRAERVALNFLQRLSGIATLTARFVAAVADLPRPPRIADTRKTTPGLRILEKYAVRLGGGCNHRASLAEAALVKDNHWEVLRRAGRDPVQALAAARARLPHTVKLAVEARTLAEVEAALAAGADIVLLDNMEPGLLRQAVALVGGRALTEASGRITLENVRAVALTGVDIISVGALTHSAPALDISLELGL